MAEIDDLLTFDPSNDQSFAQAPEQVNVNSNIYKTLPENSKSEDGLYRSKIRVIWNPFDIKRSIVKNVRYYMSDENGYFSAVSKLSNDDRECPIFKAWKKLWFSGDEAQKQYAKDNWQKRETSWCLIQVIEDENFPELVGQFKLMKMPRNVLEKMNSKMNPAKESKKPAIRLNDFLFGNVLEMEVKPGPDDKQHPERKKRETSYDLCDFTNDIQPIIKTDGSALFDDDQVDVINTYAKAYNFYWKEMAKSAIGEKTDKEKAAIQKATDKMEELKEQMREMYATALAYAKENCPNLIDECSYKEWDSALADRVQRWIDYKLAEGTGKTPQIAQAPASAAPASAAPAAAPAAPAADEYDDGLPF